MHPLHTGLQFLQRLVKQAGPTLLIELLLPGGTVFALLLHISRTGAWGALQPMPVACPPHSQYQILLAARNLIPTDTRLQA